MEQWMKLMIWKLLLAIMVTHMVIEPVDAAFKLKSIRGTLKSLGPKALRIPRGIMRQGIKVFGKHFNKMAMQYKLAPDTMTLMTPQELAKTKLSAPQVVYNVSFIIPKISDEQWVESSELENLPGNGYVLNGEAVLRTTYPFNDTGDTAIHTEYGERVVMDTWNITRFYALLPQDCTLTSTNEITGEIGYNNSIFGEDDEGRPSTQSAGTAQAQIACLAVSKSVDVEFDTPLSICEMDTESNSFATYILYQEWYKQLISEYGDVFKVFSLSTGGPSYLLGCKGSQRIINNDACENADSEVMTSGGIEIAKTNCSVYADPDKPGPVTTEDLPSYPPPEEIPFYPVEPILINVQPEVVRDLPLFVNQHNYLSCYAHEYIKDTPNIIKFNPLIDAMKETLHPKNNKYIFSIQTGDANWEDYQAAKMCVTPSEMVPMDGTAMYCNKRRTSGSHDMKQFVEGLDLHHGMGTSVVNLESGNKDEHGDDDILQDTMTFTWEAVKRSIQGEMGHWYPNWNPDKTDTSHNPLFQQLIGTMPQVGLVCDKLLSITTQTKSKGVAANTECCPSGHPNSGCTHYQYIAQATLELPCSNTDYEGRGRTGHDRFALHKTWTCPQNRLREDSSTGNTCCDFDDMMKDIYDSSGANSGGPTEFQDFKCCLRGQGGKNKEQTDIRYFPGDTLPSVSSTCLHPLKANRADYGQMFCYNDSIINGDQEYTYSNRYGLPYNFAPLPRIINTALGNTPQDVWSSMISSHSLPLDLSVTRNMSAECEGEDYFGTDHVANFMHKRGQLWHVSPDIPGSEPEFIYGDYEGGPSVCPNNVCPTLATYGSIPFKLICCPRGYRPNIQYQEITSGGPWDTGRPICEASPNFEDKVISCNTIGFIRDEVTSDFVNTTLYHPDPNIPEPVLDSIFNYEGGLINGRLTTSLQGLREQLAGRGMDMNCGYRVNHNHIADHTATSTDLEMWLRPMGNTHYHPDICAFELDPSPITRQKYTVKRKYINPLNTEAVKFHKIRKRVGPTMQQSLRYFDSLWFNLTSHVRDRKEELFSLVEQNFQSLPSADLCLLCRKGNILTKRHQKICDNAIKLSSIEKHGHYTNFNCDDMDISIEGTSRDTYYSRITRARKYEKEYDMKANFTAAIHYDVKIF